MSIGINRRFLNISLTVAGIANEPAANPTAGTQYIVGATPAGAFAGAQANSIATFDGNNWCFSRPLPNRLNLEVLNAETGDFLKFNGTAWVVVASFNSGDNFIKPVDNILPTGSTLPVSANAGDKFFNSTDGKIYTATASDTWDSGTASTNGSRYASSNEFKIFVNDNGTFSAANIPDGGFFLNKADNSLFIYDASVPALSKPAGSTATTEYVTENHSLSAEDVTAKAFSLSNTIKAGKENSVLLFVAGIAQIAGVDFSASGSSITWTGKGLADIDLNAGDVFIIHYIKE